MKKLFSILMILAGTLLMSLGATAQKVYPTKLAAGDTAVNTGTATKVIPVTEGCNGIVVQPFLTKIDGTIGGSISVWTSLNGITYDSSTLYTFTPTDKAINTKMITIPAPVPRFVMLKARGTGTMRGVLSALTSPIIMQTQK